MGSGRLPSFEIFIKTVSRDLPLSILVFLTAVTTLYMIRWWKGTGSFGLGSSKNCGIAILEVGEIPSSYLLRERLIDERWAQVFNALILSLTLRERPFCLHIHYDEGRGKIRIVLRKKPQDIDDYLVSLVQSQLPGFTIRKGQEALFPSPSKASVRQLRGNPHPLMEEIATNISEFFELSISTGDYIAFFDPFRPSIVRRGFTRRRHKSRGMGNRAGIAIGGAEAAMLNSIESERLERTGREIERFADRYALRTNLYLVAHSESVDLADRLADDIMAMVGGGFSNAKPERVNPVKFVDSLERLSPIGKPVIMSTVEARTLFQFPRTSLGIAAPELVKCPLHAMSDEGNLQGGLQIEADATQDVTNMPIEALGKQTLIMGSTGSGKTDLIINLLLDAYHNQIPFIIFSPLKGEYRALINALPEALLFTICNEQVTPLRFNPLLPPSGTLNQTHVDNFRAAFETSYSLLPPMPYILNQCMTNMYVRNGWNLLGYERGKAVLLNDLHYEIEDYTRSLGHEEDLKKEIEAALKIRIERLKEGPLGAMLSTSKPFPLDLFLSAPTIFEFDDLMDDGEKGLIITLLLNAIGEQVQTLGPNEGTRLIIVVEEAHRLLGNIDAIARSRDVADAMRGATQYVNDMLADMRAHGAGIILVDKTPSRLHPDTVRKSNTKILFRQIDDDSRGLGTTIDLNELDLKGLPSLRFGEAVVHTEKAPHAHRIRVPDLAKAHGIKKSAKVTDEEVRERMQTFYQLHPLTPYRQQVMGKGAYKCPVDLPQSAPRDANGSLCAICSPNVGNCILQYLASEVASKPDVQGKMTDWLSSSSIDIEGFEDYLLKLSETVLGEKNVKLGYCILARTRHEKVVKIARSIHRTIKIRYKHYTENGAQR